MSNKHKKKGGNKTPSKQKRKQTDPSSASPAGTRAASKQAAAANNTNMTAEDTLQGRNRSPVKDKDPTSNQRNNNQETISDGVEWTKVAKKSGGSTGLARNNSEQQNANKNNDKNNNSFEVFQSDSDKEEDGTNSKNSTKSNNNNTGGTNTDKLPTQLKLSDFNLSKQSRPITKRLTRSLSPPPSDRKKQSVIQQFPRKDRSEHENGRLHPRPNDEEAPKMKQSKLVESFNSDKKVEEDVDEVTKRVMAESLETFKQDEAKRNEIVSPPEELVAPTEELVSPPTEEVVSPPARELLIQPKKVCYEDSDAIQSLINTTEEINARIEKEKREFDALNEEVSPKIGDTGKKTSDANNNQWDSDEVPSAKQLMAMIYGLGQNCNRTNRRVETLSTRVDTLSTRVKDVGDGLIEAKMGLQTVAKAVNYNSDQVDAFADNHVQPLIDKQSQVTESLKSLGDKVELIEKKQEEYEGKQQDELKSLKDRLRVVEPSYTAPKKSGCEMNGVNPPPLPQKQHTFLSALKSQDNPAPNDALERNTALDELPKADGRTPESVEEVPREENDSVEAEEMDAENFLSPEGVEDLSQNFSKTFAGGRNEKSNQTNANSNQTPEASDKKDSNDSPEDSIDSSEGPQQQRGENTDEPEDNSNNKKEQSGQPDPGGPDNYPLPKCVYWINAQFLGNTGKAPNDSDTLHSIVGNVTMRGIQENEFEVKKFVAEMVSDETEKIQINKPYYLEKYPEQAIEDLTRRGHKRFHNTESFQKAVEGRDIFQGQQRLIICPLKLRKEGSTEPVSQSQGTPLANSDSSRTVNDSSDKHTGDNFRHSTVRTSNVRDEERRHEEKFHQGDRGSRNEQHEESGYRQRQNLRVDTEGDQQGHQGGQDRGYQGYQHGQQGGYQSGQDRGYQGYQYGQQGAYFEGDAQHGHYGRRYGQYDDRNGQYDSRDQHYGGQGYFQTPRASSFRNCFNNQGQSISGAITTPRHMTVTQKAEQLQCNPVDIAKLATNEYHGGSWGFNELTTEDIRSFGLMVLDQGVCERDIVNRHEMGMTNWFERNGKHGPQEKSILDNDHIPFLEENYSNAMLVEWWDEMCKILAQHEKIYLLQFDAINPDKGYEGLVVPGLGIERYTKMAEVLMETIFNFLPNTGEFERLKTRVEGESKNGFDALYRVLQLTLPGFSELMTEDKPVWDEENGTIDKYHKDWQMYSRIQSKDKKRFGHRAMALHFLNGIKAGEYDNMVSNLRSSIDLFTMDRVPSEVPDESKSAYLPTALRISALCDQLTKSGSRQAESGWKTSYRPSVKRADGMNNVPFEMEDLEWTLRETQVDPMVNFTRGRGSSQGRQGSGSNRQTRFKQRHERESTRSIPSSVRESRYSGNTDSTSTLTSTTGGRSAGNVPQATPRVGSNQGCSICGDKTHFYRKCPLLILGLYVERVFANKPLEYRNRFIQDVTRRLNKPTAQPRVKMLRAMQVNEQIDWSGAIPQYVEQGMADLAHEVDWEPQMMAMFKEVEDAIDNED